jgi:hypothetical protein
MHMHWRRDTHAATASTRAMTGRCWCVSAAAVSLHGDLHQELPQHGVVQLLVLHVLISSSSANKAMSA